MRHGILPFFAFALVIVGCATHKAPDMSQYYPATAGLRENVVTHSVPTNAPFGSLYEVGVYLVAPGDTLDKILARFHLTAQELASHNGCDADYLRRLKVGQRLVLYERISQ